MMPFSQPAGLAFPVFTSMELWEAVLRYDPISAMESLSAAVGRALAGQAADHSTIDFKHWVPPQGEQRKSRRVRMSASLYQMIESEQPWILLKPASVRYPRGLSLAS